MKRVLFLLVALILCAGLVQGCVPLPAQAPVPSAQEEANKQLVASNNEEVWNQARLDLIPERYAGNYTRHQPGLPTEPLGTEGLKGMIQQVKTGFPDWTCTIEDMFAAGDKVAVRYTCQGTQTGEWQGLPPTGKPMKITVTIIHRVADGKVVEDWVDLDQLGMMQQLGMQLVPAGRAE